MSTRYSGNDGGITLLEAIETLCIIAETDLNSNIEIEETGEIVIGERRAIEWLNLQDKAETERVVKEIFGLLYKYLKGVYSKKDETQRGEQVIEGIKTIMVLVGEAAKTLDKYTDLFQGTHTKPITNLPEYKKLQQFYQNRIARQVDTRELSRWIMGLSHQPIETPKTHLKGRINLQTRHEYVDLDAVKKDLEYDLFYIRKEDGSRFFSPQLVRNMTLVSNFGESLSGPRAVDNLLNTRQWRDIVARTSAASIRDFIDPMLPRFNRDTEKQKNHEVVVDIRSAIFALILSANPSNSHFDDEEKKTCFDYYNDFFLFLRRALSTREYQRLIAYPPGSENRFACAVLDMIRSLCYAFFVGMKGEIGLTHPVHEIIAKSLEDISSDHLTEKAKSNQIWNILECDNKALAKHMRSHSNGPLIQVLNAIQEGKNNYYDPAWQHNLPCQLFTLSVDDQSIINSRIPCPIHQEAVNRAFITDEFKAFLYEIKHNAIHSHHLVVNFQDRTSWREHARAKAIEDLQFVPDFTENLKVITLAKDTDFYKQGDIYALENHSAVFIESFLDQLQDESAGYYFPEAIRPHLFPKFMHHLLDAIHRVFFSEKNVLTRDQRLDFIELAYLFIQLKLIELVKPHSFSLMCKDGVDTSTCANGLLYSFLLLLNQDKIHASDVENLQTILYGPCLLQRERILAPERFNRMIGALRAIETVRSELGYKKFRETILDAFGDHFSSSILESEVFPQK